MRKITQIITSALVILMLVGIAVGYSYTNTGFKAPWFATDDESFNTSVGVGTDASKLITGTLADARLSNNVFYHGRNITLTNDTFSVLNSYWDYFTPTEFRIAKNVSFPNENEANSLVYIHSVLENSAGGVNNLVSVAQNNNISGTVGSIAFTGYGITNGNNSGSWGGWFIGAQTAGHTGGSVGVEINEISNANKTLPTGVDSSAAIGLQIVSSGLYNSSSGIHITSVGNAGFNDGIDIEKANTGINFTVPSTIVSKTAIDATGLRINSSQLVVKPEGDFVYPSVDLYPSTGGWWRISQVGSGILGFWLNGTELKFSIDANTGSIITAGGGNVATGYFCQYANRTVYTKDTAC